MSELELEFKQNVEDGDKNAFREIVDEMIITKGEGANVKLCKKCDAYKENGMFSKDSKQLDGLYTYCKECASEIRREKTEMERNDKILHITSTGKKRCTKCNRTKLLDKFHRQESNPTGYRSHCKACVGKYQTKLKARKKKASGWVDGRTVQGKKLEKRQAAWSKVEAKVESKKVETIATIKPLVPTHKEINGRLFRILGDGGLIEE